ncbi:hypothetical protein VTJ83DRAFT_4210 [Remersonia thermophila]|uniref:Pheromone receptor n=1 Tax=Remersonia thermophila TaxID=72144 RepID=A0ABR4D982_9PEZI
MAALPPEVASVAGPVLAYSLICLSCGFFLLWLVWVHDERKSYVAMLGTFVTLHTLASVIQQIHTIARWREIKIEQWENVVQNVGNPELNITGASTGLDLVLFYIQYYSYNVESMLVLFWAVELLNSVFQFNFIRTYRIHASMFAKASAMVFPAMQMLLLRFSGIDKSTLAFMALADLIMILCFGGGALILFAILVRYVHSRITLATWNVRYGQSTPSASGGTYGSQSASGTSRRRAPRVRKPSIYDRWLLLRFTIAFISLSIFQLVIINFQLRAASTNNPANVPPEPDLSVERARGDFILFAPAPTGVLFIFLVFGTTRAFRQTTWNTLVPRFIRDKVAARREKRKQQEFRSEFSTGASASITQTSAVRDLEAGGMGMGGFQGHHPSMPISIKLRDMRDMRVASGNISDGKSDEYPILKGSPTVVGMGPGGMSPGGMGPGGMGPGRPRGFSQPRPYQ